MRDFLAARGIQLPEGRPDSPPEEESVWGLGNRKQLLVEDEMERAGVEVFPGSVAWVRELREAGLKTAVVSSSRNCAAVLAYAGITDLFDTRVDGDTALELGLAGKPSPDTFLEAARRLGVTPDRAVVVEDALAGVEAGRAGGFGLVVGVDRDGQRGRARRPRRRARRHRPRRAARRAQRGAVAAGPRTHRLLAAARRIIAATGDYPSDPWRMVERAYNPEFIEQTETLFALSNGFLGIRGVLRGGRPRATVRPRCSTGSTRPGRSSTRSRRTASPRRARRSCPCPTAPSIRLLVDDDPSTCETTEVLEFERALDMRAGGAATARSCTSWRTAAGSGSRRRGSSRSPSGTWRASATRSPRSTPPDVS